MLISAPRVNTEIADGRLQITGNLTDEQANAITDDVK